MHGFYRYHAPRWSRCTHTHGVVGAAAAALPDSPVSTRHSSCPYSYIQEAVLWFQSIAHVSRALPSSGSATPATPHSLPTLGPRFQEIQEEYCGSIYRRKSVTRKYLSRDEPYVRRFFVFSAIYLSLSRAKKGAVHRVRPFPVWPVSRSSLCRHHHLRASRLWLASRPSGSLGGE